MSDIILSHILSKSRAVYATETCSYSHRRLFRNCVCSDKVQSYYDLPLMKAFFFLFSPSLLCCSPPCCHSSVPKTYWNMERRSLFLLPATKCLPKCCHNAATPLYLLLPTAAECCKHQHQQTTTDAGSGANASRRGRKEEGQGCPGRSPHGIFIINKRFYW